jgi:nucleoside phosphorylase
VSPCGKLPHGHPLIRPKKEKEMKFDGPDVGDLVIASSLAPYRLRDKVRKQIVNARVPRLGATFGLLPTDSVLFTFASQAAYEFMIDPKRVFEGLIVTGTGVKDDEKEKAAILEKFPGGLAVEEEGYSTALECAQKRIPQVVIRGISDRAGGDKQASNEEVLQPLAARNAAEVTVRVVQKLSKEWWSDARREDRV